MAELDRVCCALVLLLGGCATARYIKQTPTGGTIRLDGDRENAMKQAQQLMASHCRGPYKIVSGGEVITGTETERSQATTQTYVCGPSGGPRPSAPVADAPDGGQPSSPGRPSDL